MMNGKPTVYLETTIPSYLVARPSANVVIAGHQLVTRDFWENKRHFFTLFVSRIVLDEAAGGDATVAALRMNIVQGIDELIIDDEVMNLAGKILAAGVVPERAVADAGHIAVATKYCMNFLATWNLAHIANPFIQDRLSELVTDAGYRLPVICTPEELLEVDHHE